MKINLGKVITVARLLLQGKTKEAVEYLKRKVKL
jgi:hypothetical protein